MHFSFQEKSVREEVLGDIKAWILDRVNKNQSEKVTNL